MEKRLKDERVRRYVWIVIDRGRGRGRLTKREREKEREREIGAETEEERLKDRRNERKRRGNQGRGKISFHECDQCLLTKINFKYGNISAPAENG